MLVVIEVMTQISKGIENEETTLDRVYVLVQTVVLDTIDKGNDPKVAEARFQVILDSKEESAKSGSPLPILLSIMVAFLYVVKCEPVFKEYVNHQGNKIGL
jgi:hypothetical protein